MRLTFRAQIQLALMGTVVVIAAAAFWAVTSRIDAASVREERLLAADRLQAVDNLYQERSATLLAESEAVSLYPAVATALSAGNAAPLATWASAVAEHQATHVTVTDASGAVVARSHDPGRIGDNLSGLLPGLQRALAGQQAAGTEAGDELGLALRGYAPVVLQGQVVGAVMLADPLDATLLGRLAAGGPPLRLEAGATGSGCSTNDNQPATCRSVLLTSDGGAAATLAVSVTLTDVRRARSDALQRVLLVGLPLTLLSLVAVWLLGGRLSRSLAMLSRRADALSGVEPTLPIPLTGPPEVARLAAALEALRQRVEQSAAALQHDRDVLQAVLEATQDGIVLLDAAGSRVAGNGRWVALTAGGDQPNGTIHQQGATATLAEIKSELLSAPGRVADLTLERASPYQRLRLYSAPAPLPAAAPAGRILVLHDATQETAAERLRSALVATVSHELRSPLTAIKGYADSLLSAGPWDSETAREFLRVIVDAADRLSELVDNLLDAARLESGTLRLEREPVQLERLVQRLLAIRRPLAPRHEFELTVEGALPLVDGDPRRLEQVLGNLLDNAIKYAPDGGPITVRLQGGERVTVAVTDRGIGIPPDDLPHLCERFYRADNARVRTIKGTGLGLFISRSLVEAHGGHLRVSSRLRAGSTFTFDLPVLQQSGPEPVGMPGSVERVK